MADKLNETSILSNESFHKLYPIMEILIKTQRTG